MAASQFASDDAKLLTRTYVNNTAVPSAADAALFDRVGSVAATTGLAGLNRWFTHIAHFTPDVRKTWPTLAEVAGAAVTATTDVQTTYAMIKPDAYMLKDEIRKRIRAEGFEIVQETTTTLSKEQASEFYEEHKDRGFFAELIAHMTRGNVVGFELRRVNAIAHWRHVCGPTNSAKARVDAPDSIRGMFGNATNLTANAVHGSDSVESAKREIGFIFQTTFAMIKPDAYAKREEIKQKLSANGFVIVKEATLTLTKDSAAIFYEEHAEKKWFADFSGFMTSGPVLALQLGKVGAIKAWRAMCGPTSSEVAKKEAPTSLRALYGTIGNSNANAVHGSDSPAAAAREVELMFGFFPSNTYAMIKPDAVKAGHYEAIKKRIIAEGFEIVREKKTTFSDDAVAAFYAEHAGKGWFPEFAASMQSGPVIGFELKRHNAIKQWRAVAGPTSVKTAKTTAPNSIRALYGSPDNSNANAVHGSDSPLAAATEIALVFQNTFAMIKPDAVKAGHVEAIKKRIADAGFEIVREKKFTLDQDRASTFYAEHKSREWFPEFRAFMTSGDVVALELSRPNAIKAWRALCGPTSVKAAKTAAPESLRALYGNPDNSNANAVHGSDAPSAAQREINLMFVEFAGEGAKKGLERAEDVEAADFLDFL